MNEFSRRQVLKAFGAGVALVATGSLLRSEDGEAKPAEAAPVPKPAPAPQPFVLPPLPYSYDALEPHVDARTMEIHFTKHHQAYIDNANRALAEHPELHKLKAEELLRDLKAVPETIRTAVRNHVGGHANHSLFWKGLSPKATHRPGKALGAAIDKSFGSFDSFKERLTEACMKRFGSGWGWLSVGKDGALVVHSTGNQDSPLLEGLTPIVGIDVWEHAYYLHYQNRRQDYLSGILQVTDWHQADLNYAAALGQG
jgi:Fe-Mn family superoxide dismutase